MMQPIRRRTRRTNAEMNVVPYIDVMLVLLVIFMVVAPMIQTKVLNLPSVGAATVASEPPLVIQISASGEFSTSNQKFASQAELVAMIAKQTTEKPQPVVLAADKTVAYGDVMTVMDALKKAKVQRVGLLLRSDDGK